MKKMSDMKIYCCKWEISLNQLEGNLVQNHDFAGTVNLK